MNRRPLATIPLNRKFVHLIHLCLCTSLCSVVPGSAAAQESLDRWRYALRSPGEGWAEPDFDDSAWQQGPGGFGTRGTPGGRVRTIWSTERIWLRKTVQLDAVPTQPALLIHHDEDAEVLVNGHSVARLEGYSKKYEVVPLKEKAIRVLKSGRNLLAVVCHQTRGGQYIDVHLIDAANPPPFVAALQSQIASAAKPNRAAEPDEFSMLTAWGEEVTPANAWREYPRPQMKRGRWQCLNGLWDFAIVGDAGRWTAGRVENARFDPLLKGLPPQPKQWPHKILVPFSPETQLSGVVKSVRPNQVMWYRRTFQVPPDWSEQRVLAHFEAVDWHAVILVNGKRVGENKGGYVPFTCDVTDALCDGRDQQMVVVAWDPTNMGDQTVGKQALPELRRGFRYTPNSGIWQSVWLEPVPKTAYIHSLKITPVPHQRAIDVSVSTSGTLEGLTLCVHADRDGTSSAGETGKPVHLQLDKNYDWWSPDSPNLYGLTVELRQGEKVVDQVQSYFALRTIDIVPDAAGLNRIRLNGEPIFQFGPLDQGYWPDGALTPPSEEAARFDLKYLKDIGCNMVRVHIKVHPRCWYHEADRLGLLVWQDFVCSRKFDKQITPASAQQWELEQRRMIDHLYNHPSVVTWIVFNEGWGQFDTERLTKWVQRCDPSRLVTCASGWTDYPVGDIYDCHDYSFNISPAHGANFTDGRATLCGECGGFNLLLPGHLWHENQVQSAKVNPAGETGRESYDSVAQWQPRYRTWLTNLRLMRSGGLNAAVYTQISDVEHECNGWLTYDRKVSKFSTDQLASWHGELYEPIRTRMLFDLGAKNITHRLGVPAARWASPDFDASDWAAIPAPSKDQLRPVVSVDGGKGPLCVRGCMTLNTVPKQLAMHTVGAARQWDLFINGELVMSIGNSDRADYVPYSTILLPKAARDLLREGDNTVALRLVAGRGQRASLVDFKLLEVDD